MQARSVSNPATPTAGRRIDRQHAAFLIVDLQERLVPSIWEKERVLQETLRLARGAVVLGRPVLVTEQYRKGLGPTLPELAAELPGFHPLQKMSFSGCTEEVLTQLRHQNARDIVLCGIEAHVCVTQTALDLLDQQFRVFVVTDACSSRTPANRQAGLNRMQIAGGILVSVEMVLFELLTRAGTDEFRNILPLVK